jgi:hypothetical protein
VCRKRLTDFVEIFLQDFDGNCSAWLNKFSRPDAALPVSDIHEMTIGFEAIVKDQEGME